MSKENEEIFQRALDAFNRRDKALWLAVCDPQMENVPPRDWPESDPTRGPDAIWDFFVQGNDPWERAHFDYFDPIYAGKGRIVAEIRGEMQGKASGVRVPWSYWHVVEFRADKMWRMEWFRDRAEALEAVGMAG